LCDLALVDCVSKLFEVGLQDVVIEAFLVSRAIARAGSTLVTDASAGVIAVGCIMATILIHVFDVFFRLDVWIELAKSLESLLPSVEFPVDDRGKPAVS
jgi:hypothetical protein